MKGSTREWPVENVAHFWDVWSQICTRVIYRIWPLVTTSSSVFLQQPANQSPSFQSGSFQSTMHKGAQRTFWNTELITSFPCLKTIVYRNKPKLPVVWCTGTQPCPPLQPPHTLLTIASSLSPEGIIQRNPQPDLQAFAHAVPSA